MLRKVWARRSKMQRKSALLLKRGFSQLCFLLKWPWANHSPHEEKFRTSATGKNSGSIVIWTETSNVFLFLLCSTWEEWVAQKQILLLKVFLSHHKRSEKKYALRDCLVQHCPRVLRFYSKRRSKGTHAVKTPKNTHSIDGAVRELQKHQIMQRRKGLRPAQKFPGFFISSPLQLLPQSNHPDCCSQVHEGSLKQFWKR